MAPTNIPTIEAINTKETITQKIILLSLICTQKMKKQGGKLVMEAAES